MLLESQFKFATHTEGNGNENFGYSSGRMNGSFSGVPDGRYIPAMLTEGLSPRKRANSYTLYTSDSNNERYLMDENEPRGSIPRSQSLNSPGSSSDSKSPSSSIPTCIVAPTASEECYDSTDENSQMNKFIPSRKQREFIPENKKDDGYWEKRRKNNEAARRSREKRRYQDMALENRIMDLTRDNCKLRNELTKLKTRFGIPPNESVLSDDEDSMPTPSRSVPLNVSPPSPMNPNIIASHGILSNALTNRGPSLPPQAQASHIPGGSMSLPYPNPYVSSSHHGYPSSIKAQGSCIDHHVETDSSVKSFFSHSDNHNGTAAHTTTEREDPILGIRHSYEDHGKPVFPSAVPPVSSYSSIMASNARSGSQYWVPATDITSSDSNDDYEWGDQVQDEPLSLVKKSNVTEHSSGSDASHTSSRASNSPPSMALPHKLRHKYPHDNANSIFPAFVHGNPRISNGLAVLSKLALDQGNSLPQMASDDSMVNSSFESFSPRPRFSSNPRGMYDTKYVERRRKNNEAARKCRENRKTLTHIREVKSGYLEHENDKLKDELTDLQVEMNQLRDMLDKKKQKMDMDIKTESNEKDDRKMDHQQSLEPPQNAEQYKGRNVSRSLRDDMD